MTINEIIPILSLLGIGGIVGAFFNSFWERSKTISLQKQEYKEKRYLAIILLMYGFLEYRNSGDVTISSRSVIDNLVRIGGNWYVSPEIECNLKGDAFRGCINWRCGRWAAEKFSLPCEQAIHP
ncbi:MAG: hypothetical protein HGA87_02800 [Desulfobulbaceae bacterium]|nr:hypothetical protein [Desulfobulbaceae bacterium]